MRRSKLLDGASRCVGCPNGLTILRCEAGDLARLCCGLSVMVVVSRRLLRRVAVPFRLEAADQARAMQAVLRSPDFPSEWRYHPIALRGVSFDATCSGLDADLSTLVITGQTGSRGTRSYGSFSRQDVVTEAFLFASSSQARMIQARLPTGFMRQCLGRAGARDGHGGHIDSVSGLELKAHGVGVRGYRVVVTAGQKSTWGDYLFLQAHRAWVTIFYTSTPQPPCPRRAVPLSGSRANPLSETAVEAPDTRQARPATHRPCR